MCSDGEMVVIRNSKDQLIIAKAEIVAITWQRSKPPRLLSQKHSIRM